jgi:formate dehydrogenase subunit delta
MDPGRLIRMANQIGAFFEAEPDRLAALEGIAGHIKRFWDPRMRHELLVWIDEHDAQGLAPLVTEAIRAHRGRLAPQSV